MKFSAAKVLRKWSCRRIGRARGAVGVVAALGLLLLAGPLEAAPKLRGVPLPKPRPAEAPIAEPQAAPDQPAEPAAESTAAPAVPAAPAVSACRQALTEAIAIAPSIPDIHGAGGCGGTDLVRLEAVVLPDLSRVAVKPAAILRCAMATEIAGWIRGDVAPLAASLGSKLSELDNFDSFECRGRNRVIGAKLSEHGRANALDVRGFTLSNGQTLSLTDRAASREVREKVLLSVCSRFTTVLGPGSDWYHEDHIHLDIAERRGGYRICQWNLWEPLPQVAPLLPTVRPDEAPPREVAAKDGPPAAQPGAPEPEAEAGAEPAADPPKPAPIKKRRSNRRF